MYPSTQKSRQVLNNLHQARFNCIAWSCVAPEPQLADLEAVQAMSSTPGPMRYVDFEEIVKSLIRLDAIQPQAALLRPGKYLMCTLSAEANGVGHCRALVVSDAGRTGVEDFEITRNF